MKGPVATNADGEESCDIAYNMCTVKSTCVWSFNSFLNCMHSASSLISLYCMRWRVKWTFAFNEVSIVHLQRKGSYWPASIKTFTQFHPKPVAILEKLGNDQFHILVLQQMEKNMMQMFSIGHVLLCLHCLKTDTWPDQEKRFYWSFPGFSYHSYYINVCGPSFCMPAKIHLILALFLSREFPTIFSVIHFLWGESLHTLVRNLDFVH